MSLTDAIIEGAEQPAPGAAQVADLLPVKEAAVVPVDVSTPEEVVPESNPAAEEPQTPLNPSKVPRQVAPYRYAGTLQCHRPLPSPLCSINTLAREGWRHIRTAGKASTQGHELTTEFHTKLGVMTTELCKVHKLQQKQLALQKQQLELQQKEVALKRA